MPEAATRARVPALALAPAAPPPAGPDTDVAVAPPDAAPLSFLETLPAAFVAETRFPLAYLRMVRAGDSGAPPVRLAPSDHYRTPAYECHGFPRPISKCFGSGS